MTCVCLGECLLRRSEGKQGLREKVERLECSVFLEKRGQMT